MSTPLLVLASSSPYRTALLDQVGLRYTAVAHQCDESAHKTDQLTPDALAPTLARLKAESLREAYPDSWILGSDQVACLGHTILSKPGTFEGAVEQLTLLQGQAHQLITAVTLYAPDGSMQEAVTTHTLTMRQLLPSEIESYVRRDNPLDCAGSYKIEGRGISLFTSIQGQDYTAIVGLPMIQVVSMLRTAKIWKRVLVDA